MKKYIFLLFLSALLIQACTTSKSLAKKAKTMEDTQQYVSASDLYFQSLQKDRYNVSALEGMKRTGTLILDNYLRNFSREKLNSNYKKATYAYLDAVDYQDKIKSVGVDLIIPERTAKEFESVKANYLNQEYETGLALIESEDFKAAEQKFNEIYKFDRYFKNVKELRDIAFLEPLYRKAETFKDNNEYRKAYYAYLDILDRVPNYKSSKENSKYVLKKGQINIMIVNNKSNRRYAIFNNAIQSYTSNALIKERDPFVKIVERENLGNILDEIDLAESGIVNQEGAAELGQLTGAQYAISINVTNYSYNETPFERIRQPGYEKYRKEIFNESTQTTQYKTRYRPVHYTLYTASNTTNVTVYFKLISLTTGEIILSEIIDEYEQSFVEYISYRNIRKLYPDRNGRANTSKRAHDKLVAMSKNPRHLVPEGELRKFLYEKVSNQLTDKTIHQFSK